MGYREEFIEIFTQNITRPGADKLLEWLDTTDFYRAPASTRFHGACESGLVMHSLNVYHALMDRFYTEEESKESFAIVALLHDLCKANYYKAGTRNVKNETTGQWEKVPTYNVEDMFPYGHGEDAPGTFNRIAFFNIHVLAKKSNAHVVFFQVQHHSHDSAWKFKKLHGHGVLYTIHTGNTVAYIQHCAGFRHLHALLIAFDLLLNNFTDFFRSNLHGPTHLFSYFPEGC